MSEIPGTTQSDDPATFLPPEGAWLGDAPVEEPVADAVAAWTPPEGVTDPDTHRRDLRDSLERRLTAGGEEYGRAEVSVEARHGGGPDVVVEGAVAVHIARRVDGSRGLRHALRRSGERYDAVVAVALDVADGAAWDEVASELGGGDGQEGTNYVFHDASARRVGEPRTAENDPHAPRFRTVMGVVAGCLAVGAALIYVWAGVNPFTLSFRTLELWGTVLLVTLLLLLRWNEHYIYEKWDERD